MWAIELIVHSISYTQDCMEDVVHVENEIKRKTASECRICGTAAIRDLLNELVRLVVRVWLPAAAAAAFALGCIAGIRFQSARSCPTSPQIVAQPVESVSRSDDCATRRYAESEQTTWAVKRRTLSAPILRSPGTCAGFSCSDRFRSFSAAG